MTDLELVLDACIAQLASGTASLDQCLAHYPEHAAQLRPLLQTALRFKAAGNVQAPSMFKTRARARLYAYMQAHPRHNRTTFSPVWKVAVGFAVLLVAFLTTGTAFAQNALPGQPLYAWKLSSEKIWRALAPDPLAADLTIADRRVNELIADAPQPALESQIKGEYEAVLARLASEGDAQNGGRILHALKTEQQILSTKGISIPELNQYLLPPNSNPVVPAPAPALPPAPAIPSVLPRVIPPGSVPTSSP